MCTTRRKTIIIPPRSLQKKSTDPWRKKYLRNAPHAKKKFSDPCRKIWLHVLLVEKRVVDPWKKMSNGWSFHRKSVAVNYRHRHDAPLWVNTTVTHSWGLSFTYKRECPSSKLIKVSALTWKQMFTQNSKTKFRATESTCLNAWKKNVKLIQSSTHLCSIWLQRVKANNWIHVIYTH